MSMRKWALAALTALSLVVLGCPSELAEDESVNNPPETPSETPSETTEVPEEDKTLVEFKNYEFFPARIYKDVSRISFVTEVPAQGTTKVEMEPSLKGLTSIRYSFLKLKASASLRTDRPLPHGLMKRRSTG